MNFKHQKYDLLKFFHKRNFRVCEFGIQYIDAEIIDKYNCYVDKDSLL